MNPAEYQMQRSEELLRRKRGHLSFAQHPKTELHHVLGRKNSPEMIPLCKHCHDYLTHRQNDLSPQERQNEFLMGMQSARALHELADQLQGAIIHQWRKEHENIPTQLSSKKKSEKEA